VVLSTQVAGAQDAREVALRLRRAGDALSIRGATVTIDHTIEAGNTDSAGGSARVAVHLLRQCGERRTTRAAALLLRRVKRSCDRTAAIGS
jgi:hypothetical protein